MSLVVFGGNGIGRDDGASEINPGQILTIEADLGKGTLRFWVDSKPNGPGYTHQREKTFPSGYASGVTGKLCFATSVHCKGGAVQVSTNTRTPAFDTMGASRYRYV